LSNFCRGASLILCMLIFLNAIKNKEKNRFLKVAAPNTFVRGADGAYNDSVRFSR
jgi:hypothetical protein